MATTDKTKQGRKVASVITIVLGAAALPPAVTQESQKVTVDVAECVALEKADERLACFGAQVEAARLRAAPAQSSEPIELATDVPTGSQSPERNRRSDERSAEPAFEWKHDEIFAKVVELRETVPNAYLITLDNGQVWRQAEPTRYPLRQGLDVRLRPTKWGYRLTAPELHGQIRVERVR